MRNSQASNEPDNARATLLAAARAVVERDGVENLTFGKVAAEAGVPRSAVTAQFGRREDLLMSIVSEDLASLAHGLEEAAAQAPEPSLETLLESAAPQPAEAPKDTARQKLTRRGELAQLIEARAENAEPARTPDAWLERRLRVFERAMTAMEARQADVEKNSRAAITTAEDGVKALEATVRDLQERADAADAKAKAATNEVRGALNEASLRLQTVEGVARAALAENQAVTKADAAPDTAPVAEHAEDAVVAVANAPHVESAPAVAADAAPAEAEPTSFIAGVRKSVVAATAAAQAAAQPAPKPKKQRGSLLRLVLGSGLVLVVFVAAAGMAFSKGVSDGRREALHQIVRLPAATRAATHIASEQTPLDQLTARARHGDATAELAVARRYLETAHRDPAAALHWTSLAAVHGQAVAQYLLATLYASGTGTAADPARALQWYEAAALQGNRKAMHALAVAYAEGLGTAKSPSESVRWFARAAGFGYVDAQFNLAVLYERGLGVPQSLLDAYKWYAVAGRAGDAEAKVRLEALRTQLNGDDLAAAQSAANAFRATAYDVAVN